MPQNRSLWVRDDLLDCGQRFVMVLAPLKRISLLQQALPRHHCMLQVGSGIRKVVDETPEVGKVSRGWKLTDCFNQLRILLHALPIDDVSGKRYLRPKLVLVLRQSDSPLLTPFKDLSDTTDKFGIV